MFNSGKHTHLEWKNRVRDLLDGTATLFPEQVCSHHLCDFGVWYDSAEARQFMHIPAMAAIEKPHQELHDALSEIIELKGQNKRGEAEGLYGKVVRLSEEITVQIEEVERHLGIERKSILTQTKDTAKESDVVLF